MKKIALIIPYFGSLPNYFKIWLKSAQYNCTIDFYIITDNNEIKSEGNIIIIYKRFKELRAEIQEKFDFPISLDKPYKLCDYRPAYGLIFKEYLKKYDFWGYCDCDVILGDLRKYLTIDVLNEYDKIYCSGHLTIFKNSTQINNLFSLDHKYRCYTFKEAATTNYSCHFDEGGGINIIFEKSNYKVYDLVDFADISYRYFPFILAMGNFNHKLIFKFDKGKVFGYYLNQGELCYKEFAYIHLQKRKMTTLFCGSYEKFMIVPNKFTDVPTIIDKKYLQVNTRTKIIYVNYIKIRIKNIINNIKNGAILQRLKRIHKLFVNK